MFQMKFSVRFPRAVCSLRHKDVRLRVLTSPCSQVRPRPSRSGKIKDFARRRMTLQCLSDLEMETLRGKDILERVKFGVVNRVFNKEELERILKEYEDHLVVLKCKAKYCRPCMAFLKKYIRLADEKQDVLFLEILGDESRENRLMMIDFEVKATPTFRYYLHKKCVATTVGIKLEKIEETIQIAKPMEQKTSP